MEQRFSFNPNLMVSYTEVLIGNQSRLEDMKPDKNKNLITGTYITNPTLLLGFIFEYLLGCKDEKEAISTYEFDKKKKAQLDAAYRVNRICKKLDFGEEAESLCDGGLSPRKKLRLSLYLYYHDAYNLDEIKDFLKFSKNSQN